MLKDKWEDIWNNPKCKVRRHYSALSKQECPLRKGGC